MKYNQLSKEQLLKKINDFEHELKGYVDRVDQRYKVFYERNLAGIYRTRVNGEMLDCNDAMAQILGYSSKQELIGMNASVLYVDVNDRQDHLALLRKNKFIKNRKLALRKKDNSVIWVSISTSEIVNPKTSKIEYLEGTVIDITELIDTQEKLINSEDNYKKMLDESPYGIIIHFNNKINYFNKRAEGILEMKLQKAMNIKDIFSELNTTNIEKRQSIEIEHLDRVEAKTPEKTIYLDVYQKSINYEGQLMIEMSFVDIQDRIELEEEKIKSYVFRNLNDKLKQEIKEKEKAEKELKSSLTMNMMQSAKLQAIFENSSHVMWTMDGKHQLTSFNKNLSNLYVQLFGFWPKKYDRPFYDYDNVSKKDANYWIKAHNKVLKGEYINFITKAKTKEDKTVFMHVFMNPIYDEKLQINEASGIAHDITDKVEAETKLTDSLKEKEVLIKEIHHRVKNNLQVISSIFNLQSAYTEEDRIKEVLRESQNRIKSMAYIHESLYKTSELGQIDFEQYLRELGKNLIHSYAFKENEISLLTETERVFLELDIAIPCGLIVNEIISNSLKHAFIDRKHGIISIGLKSNQHEVELKLSDDGIGISESNFNENFGSLGIQLIQTLVEQIKGKLNVDGKNGTSIQIQFPLI